MSNKIIKTLIMAFFVGVVAFSAMTFLATDLSAQVFYYEKHIRKDHVGNVLGTECHGNGSSCKIEIIKGVPYQRP